MAQEDKYRDSYAVAIIIDNKPISCLEKVSFDEDIIYDKSGNSIGVITDIVEDVLDIDQEVSLLRKENNIPIGVDKHAYINGKIAKELEITSGIVCYVNNGKMVIYTGVIELNDKIGTIKADVLIDGTIDDMEEEYYSITDEGLKYLKELEEDSDVHIESILPNCLAYATKQENETIKQACTMSCEREERESMDNLFGNLGFGKYKGERFKLSMNGIAVYQPSTGKYAVYNKDNNEFVDATNLLFDIKDALFLLPAVEVNVGDTVIHEQKPYFIVDTEGEIKAVSYEDCTQTVLIPKSTMFGIKYFTKVFSMFGDNFAAAGDIFANPMMLMALMEGKSSDLTQLMLFSSMSKGDLGSNPMALAMMLKGDKGDDSLSTIALMSMFNNGTNPFAPKKKETKTTPSNKN